MNIYNYVRSQQDENTRQKLADYLNSWQIDSIYKNTKHKKQKERSHINVLL